MGDFQNPVKHSLKLLKQPLCLDSVFNSLQMSFYDVRNSSSFTLDTVSLF